MKRHLIYIVLLFCLASVCSCHRRYQYPAVLQAADSLCVANPDSAVSLLKSIADDMTQADEHVQMRYRLLTIKANDKAYIPHTSDSLILSLVDYYKYGGDKVYLGEAYYYAGSTYRDLGDAPRALDYYQQALDAMPGDENLKVKSKVYAQMGELFRYQKLYNEALKSYRAAYQCDSIQQDTIGLIYDLRDIAVMFWGKRQINSTMQYFLRAHELALIIHDTKMENLITSQMASLYITIDSIQLAKKFILPSLENLDQSNISSIYAIAGDIYFKAGQIDSASYYYNELLDKGTIYARRTAYERLAQIALQHWNNPKLAIDYSLQYEVLKDSINELNATEVMAQMNSLYNYQLREKENYELEEKINRNQLLLLSAAIVLLIVITISVFLILRYKNRQIKADLSLERLKQVQDKVYRESAEMLALNNKKIVSLEAELEQMRLQGKNDSQKEAMKRILENENKNLEMKLHLKEDADLSMQTSQFRNILRERVKKEDYIHEEEWIEIENGITAIYPDFLNRLQSIGELNKSEYRTCLLLKCHISPSEIASLLNLTAGGVSNIRRRLSLSILHDSTGTSAWDQFILSL
ncbi:MAG: tetratricopeptide repeat protein [Bacteroidaceae bacterium]|nr:tetratricopeptide repeat protein [Bacteroidaceae bacterium]